MIGIVLMGVDLEEVRRKYERPGGGYGITSVPRRLLATIDHYQDREDQLLRRIYDLENELEQVLRDRAGVTRPGRKARFEQQRRGRRVLDDMEWAQ